MKILVPLKRVPDPETKLKIIDGSPDTDNATWIINTFDEYAIEAALRLIENADSGDKTGEIIAITIGPEAADHQLRNALAMGVDRAIRIDANDADIDGTVVAHTLAALYKKESPDAVIMGKQAVDGDANQVGQMLAALLDVPQATFAASIEHSENKTHFIVGRETDAGLEYKRIALPCVVTVDLRIIQPKAIKNNVTPDNHEYQEGPRYASLRGIMASKKKPLEIYTFDDLSVSVTPLIKDLSYEPPEARKAGVIVTDAAELVKRLHEEAKAL